MKVRNHATLGGRLRHSRAREGAIQAVARLMQLFRASILNVRAVLMVGMVEQHFVQASPIKYLATLFASREVFFFFGWQLFVFVEGHRQSFGSEDLPSSIG